MSGDSALCGSWHQTASGSLSRPETCMWCTPISDTMTAQSPAVHALCDDEALNGSGTAHSMLWHGFSEIETHGGCHPMADLTGAIMVGTCSGPKITGSGCGSTPQLWALDDEIQEGAAVDLYGFQLLATYGEPAHAAVLQAQLGQGPMRDEGLTLQGWECLVS